MSAGAEGAYGTFGEDSPGNQQGSPSDEGTLNVPTETSSRPSPEEAAAAAQAAIQEVLTEERLQQVKAKAEQAADTASKLFAEGKGAISKNLSAEQQQALDEMAERGSEIADEVSQAASKLLDEGKEAFGKNLSTEQQEALDGFTAQGQELADDVSKATEELLMKLSSDDPIGELKAMASDLSSEDPDAKMGQFAEMMRSASNSFSKAQAIKMMMLSRLRKTRGEVLKVVLHQGERGFQDVAALCSTELETTEGVASVDHFVALLGPLYMSALRNLNLVGLIIVPLVLIAIGVALYYDWNMSCGGSGWAIHVRLWFKIKWCADFTSLMFRLWIEYKYRQYRAMADEMNEAQEKHDSLDSSELEDDEELQLDSVEMLKAATIKLKARAAVGVVALEAVDKITSSWTYFAFQLWFPLSFGWDWYGLVLAIEVATQPCNNTALSDFLYVFSFVFMVFLIFHLFWLGLWIGGCLMSSKWFREYLRGYFVQFDEEYLGGLPAGTMLFEKVVLRDSEATAAGASEAMRSQYMLEREVVKAEADQKLRELDKRISRMNSIVSLANTASHGQSTDSGASVHASTRDEVVAGEGEPLLGCAH